MVAAAEPDNDRATVLLGQSLLSSDHDRAVATVTPIDLGSKYLEEAEAIKTLANLYERVNEADSLPEDSVRGQYLDAISSARSNDFEAALDGFIQVIGKNRYYDDDGSREGLHSCFQVVGRRPRGDQALPASFEWRTLLNSPRVRRLRAPRPTHNAAEQGSVSDQTRSGQGTERC